MAALNDIRNRSDIELLVDEFYLKVVEDDSIGHFFNEVVKVNWAKHKPIMYDFWETMILGNMIYQGNPMLRHMELTKKEPLQKEHFDRWMELWNETVIEFFSGKNADEAVVRAKNIALLMQHKTGEINR